MPRSLLAAAGALLGCGVARADFYRRSWYTDASCTDLYGLGAQASPYCEGFQLSTCINETTVFVTAFENVGCTGIIEYTEYQTLETSCKPSGGDFAGYTTQTCEKGTYSPPTSGPWLVSSRYNQVDATCPVDPADPPVEVSITRLGCFSSTTTTCNATHGIGDHYDNPECFGAPTLEFAVPLGCATQGESDETWNIEVVECLGGVPGGGGGGDDSNAALIGGVVGGVLGAAALAGLGVWYWRRTPALATEDGHQLLEE